MKFSSAVLLVCVLIAGACNKQGSEQDQQHDHATGEAGPNQELYDQVIDIHDEVMPKMNDLYKAKTALSARLKTPGIGDSERKEIGHKIAKIDSASESMMVWMRQFEPPDDSVSQDSARHYLEDQLTRVKKVREDILNTLENSH